MTGRVTGRVALVTGASSGLGKRFAQVLAAEGAKVVVAARRKQRLDDLVNEIGGNAFAVQCDVTNEAQVIDMFDAAEQKFGLVDTVVNNAGMTHANNAVTQDIAEFRKIMDLNVTSVWCVAREAARRVIKAGPEKSHTGRIVNIPSLAGQPADFITIQMILLREGLRNAPAMQPFAAGKSDQDIQDIAAYFATLPPGPPDDRRPRDPALFAAGQALSGPRLLPKGKRRPDCSGRRTSVCSFCGDQKLTVASNPKVRGALKLP